MFLGTFTPKLDDKGRLTLPAKFRDELAGGLMITKSQDHSLAIYPPGTSSSSLLERQRQLHAMIRQLGRMSVPWPPAQMNSTPMPRGESPSRLIIGVTQTCPRNA